MTETQLFAPQALLSSGWALDVLIEFSADGDIVEITAEADPGEAPRAAGPVVPGMPNLHSHAFQRAMAGLAEHTSGGDDSFWTWREVMYRFLERLSPDQVHDIAAQLYIEMLKQGYTAVGEFHYLHHDPHGRPYANSAEMSIQVVSAALEVGIGITHLPVLYCFGGFGGAETGPGQRRFLNTPDELLEIVKTVGDHFPGDTQVRVGIAPHSLRAVTPETLFDAVAGIGALDREAPIHIHIAEQVREIEDCLEWSGQRPVQWLLDHAEVDDHWCLVHATHMTDPETASLAKSGAIAGLCPTTEANLGDGLFQAPLYLQAGGHFGIGSDSHISISPVEELRWLEYGQRLAHRRRSLLTDVPHASAVGAGLYRMAVAGGAAALGRPIGALAPSYRADLVVLDAEAPVLYGKAEDRILDAFVFAGNQNLVRDVMVGGEWRVREGRHLQEEAVLQNFRSALARLAA